MTYKILLHSDLHLRINDPLGTPLPGGRLTTRIDRKLFLLESVIELAVRESVDELVDLGDLFDSINPASRLRNAYARVISRALDAHIRVVRVCGNHETDGREADGLDASLLASGYHLVTGVEDHPVLSDLIYVPEINYDQIVAALADHPQHMVLGHFGVRGAVYPSGEQELSGVDQAYFTSRLWPTYLGHIHRGQVLVDKVVYVGAMARANFGDMHIEPRCCLVTIEYDQHSHAILDTTHKFYPLDDIGLTEIKFVEGRKDEIDRPLDVEIGEGDVIKLVYEGSHDWFATCNPGRYAKLLTKLGASKVIWNFKPVGRRATAELPKYEGTDKLNIVQMLVDQARADGQDPAPGAEYYHRALEGQDASGH
jgi:DNA repair exonuclease SbcCD nuclease subunit